MPSYPQGMPVQPYAGQPYVQPSPAGNYARPVPGYAATPAAAPPSRPTPRYVPRAQDSEEHSRLQLPSPEQLGVVKTLAPAPAAGIDWSAIHQRLNQLGATCFHLEKLARGCRVTCLLPTAQADRSHRIEAEAGTEAEAVSLAIAQVESWAGRR